MNNNENLILHKKYKLIILIIFIIFIQSTLVMIFLFNKFEIIDKITKLKFKKEETSKISYQVYDNSTENKLKTLITINDTNGIDYVECPNNKIIGNKKKQITFDYIMDKNENYTFKVKSVDNDNINEYTISANDKFINDNGVKINKIKEQNGYKVIDIENMISLDGYKTYYKIGQDEKWIEGKGKIAIHDYDLMTSNLINKDNTISIAAKIENEKNKETVILNKKFEVDTEPKEDSFEADSLIDAVGKTDISTGLYAVNVNDERYNLKIYSFDSNLELDTDTKFGSEEDVAAENKYAKNMIVLKVNGDLIINDGVTLTSYTSKDGYGGPKGMMIYCTGTITNKGTISMTARGAKAEGENVYLWQNLDDSYEYIPAVGAAGGESVTTYRNQYSQGNDGKKGTGRQTGGGGSGGANGADGNPITISGAGGNGTSYSGGTGGGGCNQNSYGTTIKAEDGSSIGGSGGAGIGYRASSSWASRLAGGGAGNPGGKGGENGRGNTSNGTGENGTGGLLIIYSNNINNAGKIEANGSDGSINEYIGGGSSGGGSINVFYKENIDWTGITEAKGGNIAISGSNTNGSHGGDGTISVGNINSGTYQSYIENVKLKDSKVELTKIINNEEVQGNNGNKVENKTEYNLEISEKPALAEITWKSSNENIVSVDKYGKIKLVNSGTATITCIAKTKLGIEYTDSCEVTAAERLYLYYYGNKFTSITGGYEKCARSGRRFSATFNNDNIYIDCNESYGGGGVYTANAINLTQYKYLKSYGKVTSLATYDSNGRQLATTTSKTWGTEYSPANNVTFSVTSRTTELLTLSQDITSLNATYYICNGFNQSHGYIYEIWLEK